MACVKTEDSPGLHDSDYAEQFSIISPWPLEPGEQRASIITDKLSPFLSTAIMAEFVRACLCYVREGDVINHL